MASRSIRVLSAPIQPTRGPFINTPLVRVPSPAGAPERFWTSTWNSNEGNTSALFDEFGAHELHKFPRPHFGFYSAVALDARTLWLCGDLSRVVRYDPVTRKSDVFETGAKSSLVFNGMAFDPATKKLFAFSNTSDGPAAFSFDTKRLKPAFSGRLNSPALYCRFSFPVGDGRFCLVGHLPGQELVYWDPKTDQVENVTLAPTLDVTALNGTSYFLLRENIEGSGSCVYYPSRGWFDPRKRRFIKGGPRPEREATWMCRWKHFACGVSVPEVGVAAAMLWDMKSGAVREVCRLSDTPIQNVNFTRSGAVVSISMYGEFRRHDMKTGELRGSRVFDAQAMGAIDCLTRVAPDRVVGTTFITQRFWDVNLKTQKGADLGKAAPGVGEIMKLVKTGGKVYMAAYTGGELTEYDPAQPARFPENPRLVATPPNAMRPVAILAAGGRVFYASNNHYGHLGCVLARYDTRTGVAQSAQNPTGDCAIRTLSFDASAKRLIAGTSIDADCASAPPTARSARIVTIDPKTLEAVASADMPAGTPHVYVVCPMGGGKWAVVTNPRAGKPGAIFEVSIRQLSIPPESRWRELKTQGVMAPTRTPGVVVMRSAEGIGLWDLKKLVKLRALAGPESAGWHMHVEGDDILCNDATTVRVLDGALRGV